jgi:tetratricopeptide (TPR) repeat protein
VSKVNELRRKATQAVRGRDYDRAIKLYGKICELDPSNGTPRNELGDLYLKTGNQFDAMESFSLSARLYRDFGLTNNAVAVFKKILRHDPNHLDSLWGLAEIRRQQGLDAEASSGFLEYLARAEQVPEAGREEYFSRAGQLVTLMADDLEILSRLEDVFRAADRGEDVASVLIAKALQAHLEEEFEVRDRYIEHAKEACEIFESLPAYHDYLDVVNPVDCSEDPGPGAGELEPGVIELDEESSDGLEFEIQDPDFEDEDDEYVEVGPTTIMLDTDALDLGFDFDGDVEDAVEVADPVSGAEADPEGVSGAAPSETETAGPRSGPVDEPASGSLNLLDEILADGAFDVGEDQQRQIDTIALEMQGQIAGDVDPGDHAGQYELGIVYMDMGLFEQALTAFEMAAEGDIHRLGALEMRGTCLLRLGRDSDALASFQEGLEIEGAPERAYLGLLYGVGCCLELRGEVADARTYFERVAAVDPRFLDVTAKLDQIREPS